MKLERAAILGVIIGLMLLAGVGCAPVAQPTEPAPQEWVELRHVNGIRYYKHAPSGECFVSGRQIFTWAPPNVCWPGQPPDWRSK